MKPKPRIFLDTNVLVYAYDTRDAQKHNKSLVILRDALSTSTAFISTQVIGEFCNVMAAKEKLMQPKGIRSVLVSVLRPMLAHAPSADFYSRALSLTEKHSISFYDALIVQSAQDLECDILYTEDLQDGQKFGNLTIENPFK